MKRLLDSHEMNEMEVQWFKVRSKTDFKKAGLV